MADFRIEKDSMGEMQVPADAYYGASTARAVENFPISGLRFSRRFICALGRIKAAAARVNKQLDLLDERRTKAIEQACLEVADGNYIEVFQHPREAVVPDAPSPIRHLCLEVDDIESVSRALKTHGFEVSDKKLGGDQSWQAWTTDPSGVRIEFHQYTQTSAQRTGKDCILT